MVFEEAVWGNGMQALNDNPARTTPHRHLGRAKTAKDALTQMNAG